MAIPVLLILNTMVLLLHLAILLQIIPYGIIRGGKLTSLADMYLFEGFAILVNLLFSTVLLIKGGYLRTGIPVSIIQILLWLFLGLYLLNTIGNLFAATVFEKCFAVITLVFSLFTGMILSERK